MHGQHISKWSFEINFFLALFFFPDSFVANLTYPNPDVVQLINLCYTMLECGHP